MKMKELEEATGVGRETIRFYIREGLLPAPDKPSRNVAWYDESFVPRIALIKELQTKRFLPLHVIKALVAGDDELTAAETSTLSDLESRLSVLQDHGEASDLVARPMRLSALAERSGLSAAELLDYERVGLIRVETRDGDQWVDVHGVRIAELMAQLRREGFDSDHGFDAESYRPYVDFVRWLAREEVRLFSSKVAGKISSDEAARLAEAGIDTIGRLVAEMRRATLLRWITEGRIDEGPNGSDLSALGDGKGST